MEYIKRLLNINLPSNQSAFLWGPRKTGKSTYLKENFPDSEYFDLLLSDLYFDFVKNPSLFRERILALDNYKQSKPIIVDEVQKIPLLLDEIHWLIENRNLRFILSGSSPRKLKRGKANLLGGRAWRYEMLPLTSEELGDFNLLHILNSGLIPSHYSGSNYRKSIDAYIKDYLKEEVFEEGLTRNIPAFSRFFDSMGYSHGELTNYANIARDCGVNSKTVKEYYQILADTLLGVMIDPFKKRQHRQVISKAGKFYLFDVGVAGAITHINISEGRGEQFGKAVEHFILMELLAFKSYKENIETINFWRTKSGLEVDFILNNGEIAIEVKSAGKISRSDIKPLKEFRDEFKPRKAILICNESAERNHEGINIIPLKMFLKKLWSGEII
jgi:predicted AAA+ superfamily ATPase